MGRTASFAYGILSYVFFFVTFLYAIAFIGNIFVPKTIDSGEQGSVVTAVVINLLLLSIFAIQHSVMARPAFKKVWTKIVPESIERSTYVLLSTVALGLICAFWQPLNGVIWDFSGSAIGTGLWVLFFAGWLVVLSSTFMIDHFDLFGLRQVYLNLKARSYNPRGFQKNVFYKLVRHPIMTGFLIAFWAAPVMSVGHLLFAVVTTIYIYIAVKHFEEKDLVKFIGPDYIAYQKEVGMLIPGVGKKQ
jgi:protein-S-isoprenylcysteine O-methyltransferase Ste14